MQNAKDLREARRKRILERGSDRLAFITGQAKHIIKNTPMYEEASSVESSEDGFERRLHEQTAQHLTATPSEGFEYTEEAVSVELNKGGFERRGQGLAVKPSPSTATDAFECTEETSVQPIQNGFERSFQEDMVQPKPASSSETFGNVEQASPAVTSGIEFQGRKDEIFFPKTFKSINVKYLRESIDRSRNIRASLAAFIALVVAIQHVLLSHGITWGTVLSIWLFSWPIGIILLTDVSAIIMPLVLWNQLQYKQEEDVDSASKDTDGETNKFLKAVSHFQVILKAGLLLKQIGDAIFLDCSIYVVVLIFSLNLGQYPFSR